jgi:hypothetical protein
MFRAIILPILRSIRLCDTACGKMHSICGRSMVRKRSSSASGPPTGHILYWVHYITSCITQSNAPEDGQNNRPKHVELIGIINKQLLLRPAGCLLYYLLQLVSFSVFRTNFLDDISIYCTSMTKQHSSFFWHSLYIYGFKEVNLLQI